MKAADQTTPVDIKGLREKAEAAERVRAWLARGNPPGGMNLPRHDGSPSIQDDLRTLLAERDVLRGALEKADRGAQLVTELAFEIAAPNPTTPQLVMVAQAIQNAARTALGAEG